MTREQLDSLAADANWLLQFLRAYQERTGKHAPVETAERLALSLEVAAREVPHG